MNPLYYLFLIIIPIFALKYFTNKCTAIFIVGFTLPMIFIGLYSLYFIPYIGLIFIIFLPLSIFFNEPAWWFMVKKSALINGMNLSFINKIELDILNGFFWGIIFFLICLILKKLKS